MDPAVLARKAWAYLEKAQPPHGPPRPGLEWKEETHRWVRPDTGEPDAGDDAPAEAEEYDFDADAAELEAMLAEMEAGGGEPEEEPEEPEEDEDDYEEDEEEEEEEEDWEAGEEERTAWDYEREHGGPPDADDYEVETGDPEPDVYEVLDDAPELDASVDASNSLADAQAAYERARMAGGNDYMRWVAAGKPDGNKPASLLKTEEAYQGLQDARARDAEAEAALQAVWQEHPKFRKWRDRRDAWHREAVQAWEQARDAWIAGDDGAGEDAPAGGFLEGMAEEQARVLAEARAETAAEQAQQAARQRQERRQAVEAAEVPDPPDPEAFAATEFPRDDADLAQWEEASRKAYVEASRAYAAHGEALAAAVQALGLEGETEAAQAVQAFLGEVQGRAKDLGRRAQMVRMVGEAVRATREDAKGRPGDEDAAEALEEWEDRWTEEVEGWMEAEQEAGAQLADLATQAGEDLREAREAALEAMDEEEGEQR
jgi:hypothetical protein